MELVTVLCSNLPDLDDSIKTYLLSQPDMTFAMAFKIILRSSITPGLIVQLTEFKNYLKSVDPCLFLEVFGKKRARQTVSYK